MRHSVRPSSLGRRAWVVAALVVLSLGLASVGPDHVNHVNADASLVPLFRLFNSTSGDHLYTTEQSEVLSAQDDSGYSYEGIVGFVSSGGDDAQGLVKLHRLYNPETRDHLLSTDLVETLAVAPQAGYTYEGVVGYVWQKPLAGQDLVPLHRTYNVELAHHFFTAGRDESSDPEMQTATDWLGYQQEGTTGWIRANPLEMTLSTAKSDYYPHEPIEFDIALRNRGPGALTLHFGSADTRVYESIAIAWLSHNAMVFRSENAGRYPQVVTEVTLQPGQTLHQRVTWDQHRNGGGPFVNSGYYFASARPRAPDVPYDPICAPVAFAIN